MVEDIDEKCMLINDIKKKSITISESLKHIDLNSQDEIDLIISIADALEKDIEDYIQFYCK